MATLFTGDLSAPAALRSAERLHRRMRHALVLVGVLVLMLFCLATVVQVAGAVAAAGEITVESSVKTISHPSGGVLAGLSVRDGDRVTKGQELLRFDAAVSQVGSTAASLELAGLLAARARLEAERAGAATIAVPPELAASEDPGIRDIVQRERSLFALRMQDRAGTLALLRERLGQYQEQIRSLEAQIAAVDQQARLIRPELAGLRSLYGRQLVTLGRINELERTAASLQGSRGALSASIAETRGRISETREQMLNVGKASRSEAATQLAGVIAQLNEQRYRLASAQDAFGRTVIRAPQSGTVDKLAFTTIGSAIPANQPILQIVPDTDELLVSAAVRPADVDSLRIGQSARLVFSGFDRQTTPELSGSLIFVSPDLTQDSRTGQSYYRIKVRIASQERTRLPLPLKPGMPAEVFVQTGDRSILSFVLKPLLDQMRRAFRDG